MTYQLKVDFPSGTNHSFAVTGLGTIASDFIDNGDHLIFDRELTLDECSMINDFGGVIRKCETKSR